MRGWAVQGGSNRFFHVPAGGRRSVMFRAGAPWMYFGHWRNSAMHPCQGPGCPACELGVGRQPRFCIEVNELEGGRWLIWEFGQGVARAIQEALGVEDVEGLCVEVSREGRRNGRIVVEHTAEVEVRGMGMQERGELEEGGPTAEEALRSWWRVNNLGEFSTGNGGHGGELSTKILVQEKV